MADFIGLQYPIKESPNGLLASMSDVNQIKADMLQLLLTNPGERVMLPTFGVPLRRLIFEQNDTTLEVTAQGMIAQALQEWEPRVIINQIVITSKFNPNELNFMDDHTQVSHILGIKIEFIDPQNIQTVEQLTLELPLGG